MGKWLVIGILGLILIIVIIIIIIIIIWRIKKEEPISSPQNGPNSTPVTQNGSNAIPTPQNGDTSSDDSNTTPPNINQPTTESLIQKMQTNAGRLSMNGKCLYLDAPMVPSHNYPSIKSGYSIKMTPCNNNETRQVWIMDDKQRLTLENSDRKHCIRNNGGISGNISIWGCIDEFEQIWKPVPNPNNSSFKLVSQSNNNCLTGSGNYASVVPCVQRNNIFWTFIPK